MERRDFIRHAGLLTANLLAGQVILTVSSAARADEMTGLPLGELAKRIGRDGVVCFPSDEQFAAYAVSFNRRVTKMPQVRCLPKTAQAAGIAVKWAREFGVAFAVRGRGHSYEGYSQSDGLVIDMRLMSDVQYNPANKRASVGGGAQLWDVYSTLAPYGMTIPAGTCPPVGVGGHTLGGGYGFLARKYGLACDSVVGFELVDASGDIQQVTSGDLFWALKGGGQGNFGIVTRFIFQTHPASKVATFGMDWTTTPEKGLAVVKAWQKWAPNAPVDITSSFRLQRTPSGLIRLHASGLTLGSVHDLEKELSHLPHPDSIHVKPMTYLESVMHFGGTTAYESINMKGKSDYLFKGMSDDGLMTLMKSLISSKIVMAVMFDAYGGAVGRLKNSETAFVHREGTQYCIQYYAQWKLASESAMHIDEMRKLYAAMRPYVSGQAYVNYCDLDLQDAPKAYWAENLDRLRQIKTKIDPTGFFKHAQSL